MRIQVRTSGALSEAIGQVRLGVSLPEGATVGDLVEQLALGHPDAAAWLRIAVPVLRGRTVGMGEPLCDGQEAALIVPVAGG